VSKRQADQIAALKLRIREIRREHRKERHFYSDRYHNYKWYAKKALAEAREGVTQEKPVITEEQFARIVWAARIQHDLTPDELWVKMKEGLK
jgi:hypothetical protein